MTMRTDLLKLSTSIALKRQSSANTSTTVIVREFIKQDYVILKKQILIYELNH